MSEPTLRRRRTRLTDRSEIDIPPVKPAETEALLSTSSDTQIQSDHVSSSTPQIPVEPETNHQTTIDRIRSSIKDEEYYYQLDEPDYSDESHNWGNDYELTSSDYWHFLGRYE